MQEKYAKTITTRHFVYDSPAEILTALGLGTDLDVEKIELFTNGFDREIDLVVTFIEAGERQATIMEGMDKIHRDLGIAE
jgi:hypothetical protein